MLQAQQTSAGLKKPSPALGKSVAQAQQTNNPDLSPLLADKFLSTEPTEKLPTRSRRLADAKASKIRRAENENCSNGIRRYGIATACGSKWHRRKGNLWTPLRDPIHW